MLKIDKKDKILKITDDEFNGVKIESVKNVIEEYNVEYLLDFKITITEVILEAMENSADITPNKPTSPDEMIYMLEDMFDSMQNDEEADFEKMKISVEFLFLCRGD